MEVNHKCDRLTKAPQETISQAVPNTVVCPHSKCWWTKELKELRKSFRKLGRNKQVQKPTVSEHTAHMEFREICRVYDNQVHQEASLAQLAEKATEPDIWTANKYITASPSNGGKIRIPVLQQQIGTTEVTANTNHDKSNILAKGFFPNTVGSKTIAMFGAKLLLPQPFLDFFRGVLRVIILLKDHVRRIKTTMLQGIEQFILQYLKVKVAIHLAINLGNIPNPLPSHTPSNHDRPSFKLDCSFYQPITQLLSWLFQHPFASI